MQHQMLDRYRDTFLIISGGYPTRYALSFVYAICHTYAPSGISKHVHIVWAVPDGHDLLPVKPQPYGDVF
jgi:hypothetical protein